MVRGNIIIKAKLFNNKGDSGSFQAIGEVPWEEIQDCEFSHKFRGGNRAALEKSGKNKVNRWGLKRMVGENFANFSTDFQEEN